MLQEHEKIHLNQKKPWFGSCYSGKIINTESLNDLSMSVVRNPFIVLSISCYELIIIIIVSRIIKFQKFEIELVDLLLNS